MRAPDAALVGTVLGGRVRIERLLSEGGMGAVYEATQLGLGRRIAVKVVHPMLGKDAAAMARFEREAKLVAALGHPNIVQVLDFQSGTAEEPAWMAMELVAGRSLSAVMERETPVAPARVVAITLGVLSALEAAHGVGAVHRDLKPGNVMVTTVPGVGEVAKVLDFGIAKLADGDGAAPITLKGQVLGTPMYMAPEQAQGHRVDGRADVYSAGMIAWALLAGRAPFPRGTPKEILHSVVEMAPPSLSVLRPDVPPDLEAVIAGAIAKRPDARFQSARAMADALRELAGVARSDPGAARPMPTVQRDASTLQSGVAPSSAQAATIDVPRIAPTAVTPMPTAATPMPTAATVVATPRSTPRHAPPAKSYGVPLAIAAGLVTLAGLLAALLITGAVVAVSMKPHTTPVSQPLPVPPPQPTPPTVVGPGPLAPAPQPQLQPEPSTQLVPGTRTMRGLLAEADRLATSREPRARVANILAGCVTSDGRAAWSASCAWYFEYVVLGTDTHVIVNFFGGESTPSVQTMTSQIVMTPFDEAHLPDSDELMRRSAARCPHVSPNALIVWTMQPFDGKFVATVRRNDGSSVVFRSDAEPWPVVQATCSAPD